TTAPYDGFVKVSVVSFVPTTSHGPLPLHRARCTTAAVDVRVPSVWKPMETHACWPSALFVVPRARLSSVKPRCTVVNFNATTDGLPVADAAPAAAATPSANGQTGSPTGSDRAAGAGGATGVGDVVVGVSVMLAPGSGGF